MSHTANVSLGALPTARPAQSRPSRMPARALHCHDPALCSLSSIRRNMPGMQLSSTRPLGPLSSSMGQGMRMQHARRGGLSVHAGRDVDIADRAVSAVPYLVPLFDGLKYGRFLFAQFPALARLLSPLNPLISLYFSFPFASLIIFFAIYAGIVNNQNFSRYVRFNALQSILLDIILIIPGLIEQVLRPPMGGPFLTIYVQLYNAIFFFVFASVLYAVGSCLFGETPRVPLVADAADQQVR